MNLLHYFSVQLRQSLVEYMVRDEKGIIDQIVKNIVMCMYLIMSVGLMLIFSRYSKVE